MKLPDVPKHEIVVPRLVTNDILRDIQDRKRERQRESDLVAKLADLRRKEEKADRLEKAKKVAEAEGDGWVLVE